MASFSRRLISLILVITTFMGIGVIGFISAAAASDQVMTTDAVRLRSSATTNSDNVITVLNVNEKLTLLENSNGGWAYVSRSDGTKGYCSVNYLQIPSGSSVKLTGVTTDDVNFRKGPSTDYGIIRLLYTGTTFDVLDNTVEGWVKAKSGSDTGYLSKDYVTLILTLPAVSEVTDIPSTPNWFEDSALDDIVKDPIENTESVQPEGIAFPSDSIEIERGQKSALAVYTTGGESVQGAVVFSSSDSSIATVTAGGIVKGLKVGTTDIVARLEGTHYSAICKIIVNESTTQEPEKPIVLSDTKVSVYKGNHYHIKADVPVSWKTSNSSVVSVSGGIITANKAGSAVITAYTATQSVQCKVTVTDNPTSMEIYRTTAVVTAEKTYYNGVRSTLSTTWTSSDTSVAKVQNGFITGISEGTAVVTAKNSSGTKTCLVTVKAAEPVRFAFTEPNTAAKNETVTLYAVTDLTRTAVKFNVTVGGTVKTVNATKKVADGDTLIWSGTTSISSSGTYNVVAYSKQNGDWQTCSSSVSDAKTTIFVRESSDLNKETTEKRRPSDNLINLISQFEGYSSGVYFDTIAGGIPTLGYGKVIYIGDTFYNNMTKKEAYAYLVQTVNDGGFTSAVNNYLDNYSIKRNQQQFDSLVSFVYNLGANILSGDSDFKKIFLATNIVEQEPATDKDAYINGSDVNIRSGPSTSDKVLATLSYGTELVLLEASEVNGWYHVKTKSGIEGYVYATYVTKGKLSKANDYSLGRVDKAEFTKLLLQYHHSGATCVSGLLYRRVDELDVFYHGDYVRNGSKNIYGYKFSCAVNSSTRL